MLSGVGHSIDQALGSYRLRPRLQSKPANHQRTECRAAGVSAATGLLPIGMRFPAFQEAIAAALAVQETSPSLACALEGSGERMAAAMGSAPGPHAS